MIQPNDHADQFGKLGYIRVPSVFHEDEMRVLIQEIQISTPRIRGPSSLNAGNMTFYSNVYFNSPAIQHFVSDSRIVDLLYPIIGPNFWVRWDQAVFKGPGAGSFPWHQDNVYNHLKDAHFQLWIALSKINDERGGLWLAPRSHLRGDLQHSKKDNHFAYEGPIDEKVTIDAEIGDVILFSSRMLHYTSPNISTYDRWAYVVEYMSCDHYDPYIHPPYFIVAQDGKRSPKFVTHYSGSRRIVNRAKYLGPRLKYLGLAAVQRGRQALEAIH